MDLNVSVNGVEQTITGLTSQTTCAEVIYALAHAQGQPGRYVLVERFCTAERNLLPTDRPIEMLAKWKEHAKNVSYYLKRIEEKEEKVEEVEDPSTNPVQSSSQSTQSTQSTQSIPPNDHSEPIETSTFTQRMPSTSSVRSDVLYSVIKRKTEFAPSGSSTTSLPAYTGVRMRPGTSMGTMRSRAPPPDYASVMERRFNSLSRNPHNSHSRPPLDMTRFGITQADGPSSAPPRLTEYELQKLIEAQNYTLEQQRQRLYETDVEAKEEERELIQLERQMENLEEVLHPLRQANWPQQYNVEYTTQLRLKMGIQSIKDAIQNVKRNIDEKTREEQELTKAIFEEMSLEDSSSFDSPHLNIQQGMKAF
ncbi:unnamed protein product, partial [Mesorhabditis belari]|uniref:Ras-associating domain-containing protein n=1 Tax=Mesorhabditis belari TaxID=2138241 RepID=A0AAF3FIT5_9BILA